MSPLIPLYNYFRQNDGAEKDEERFIIIATPRKRSILNMSSCLYFDPTFKLVSELFSFLFFIHEEYNIYLFYAFSALMARKIEIMCRRVWKKVEKLLL
ncbi:hypothetical protein HZS_713 [Henneguya salminicola]|nr:hypothetical protein HZS_713 [Henneguya salminicola]